MADNIFLAARASQAHVKLRKAELRPAEPAEAGTYRSEQIWIYGIIFFRFNLIPVPVCSDKMIVPELQFTDFFGSVAIAVNKPKLIAVH